MFPLAATRPTLIVSAADETAVASKSASLNGAALRMMGGSQKKPVLPPLFVWSLIRSERVTPMCREWAGADGVSAGAIDLGSSHVVRAARAKVIGRREERTWIMGWPFGRRLRADGERRSDLGPHVCVAVGTGN